MGEKQKASKSQDQDERLNWYASMKEGKVGHVISFEGKLSEFVCPTCKRVGTLIGSTPENVEFVEKFGHRIWSLWHRTYFDDEPENNLKCSRCGYGISGRLGWGGY